MIGIAAWTSGTNAPTQDTNIKKAAARIEGDLGIKKFPQTIIGSLTAQRAGFGTHQGYGVDRILTK